MPHLVLFGDSIFDNRAYTGREPDVITHLHGLLEPSWHATLLAVDGATTSSISAQVRRAPTDVTHAVVSVGGNDALGNMDLLLELPTRSTADALALFGRRVGAFEANYQEAVGWVASLNCPVTLCTIYNGNLREEQAALARLALMIFNDAILRTAFERRAGVIDLRLVCNEASDYANPIEPSGRGGLKIATAIARAAGAIPGASSVVWK
jgi:hypothetical protein